MKRISLMIGSIALLVFSCKEPQIVPPPAPDEAALIAFNKSNNEDMRQLFVVNANAPIYIVGEKGTSLYLGADQLLDATGNLVTGDVLVTLIEVTNKSEMVMLNKATMGKKSNGDHATLVSGGEFYVSMSQYGIELTLASPLTIQAYGANDPSMRKFVNRGGDEDLLWEIAADSLLEIAEADTVGGVFGDYTITYEILPGEWGWTNIDKFYSDPGPKTTIFAELPEGFNNTNCEVYISYDGESNALAAFDTWVDGRFTEHYGLIPIGLNVHFIAIGIISGELNYVIEPATITADHVQILDGFTSISEESLVNLINELP